MNDRKLINGIGWLCLLIGACGHFWLKWFQTDSPGSIWFAGESISAYLQEHLLWWSLIALGLIVLFVSGKRSPR